MNDFKLDDGKSPVVAIGGGHGLASTLRALNLTDAFPIGIVSVADDGGSSGRLRRELGLLPPGDVRKCLIALSDLDSTWTRAFAIRFQNGELEGHSLGNLILAGLTEVTGDFASAIAMAGELLGARGAIYPSSFESVMLCAKAGETAIEGQVKVMNTPGIDEVFVVPADPEVPPAALQALREAKTIIAGPGSLFTSLAAVLCIPKIRCAIEESTARKIYIANLRQQSFETQNFTIADHVRALACYGFTPNLVLADDKNIDRGDVVEYCQSIEAELVVTALAEAGGHTHAPELLAKELRKSD